LGAPPSLRPPPHARPIPCRRRCDGQQWQPLLLVRARAAAAGVVLLDRCRRLQRTETSSAAGNRRAALRVDGATTPSPGAIPMHELTRRAMAAADRPLRCMWSWAWRREVVAAAVSAAAVVVATARGATASVCIGWRHLGRRPRVGTAVTGAPPGWSARRGSPGRRGTDPHLPLPLALDPPQPCATVADMECSRILNALEKDAVGEVADEICGGEPVLAISCWAMPSSVSSTMF